MKIMVTGLGGPGGANVVYYLPKESVSAVCDSDPAKKAELARIGRSDIRFFTVPNADKPDAYKRAINSIIIRWGIDVIIPSVDEELLVFSYRPEHINAKVIVSPYSTIKTCSDKFLLYGKLKGEDFCPDFVVTDNRQDLYRFGTDRLFMKPRVGRGSRGVKAFSNYQEIPKEDINKTNVFCEFLPGDEFTVDCLFDFEGNPVVIVPRRRVEVDKGISARGETRKHPEIEEKVKKLSNIFKFIGHVNIQFKADTEGNMKLVEINPRFSGGLPITAEAGANTADLLYRMLNGERITPPEWREGVFENKILNRNRR